MEKFLIEQNILTILIFHFFSPIVKYVLEVGSLSPSTSLLMINEIVFSFLDKELNKANNSDLEQLLSNNLISDL